MVVLKRDRSVFDLPTSESESTSRLLPIGISSLACPSSPDQVTVRDSKRRMGSRSHLGCRAIGTS